MLQQPPQLIGMNVLVDNIPLQVHLESGVILKVITRESADWGCPQCAADNFHWLEPMLSPWAKSESTTELWEPVEPVGTGGARGA